MRKIIFILLFLTVAFIKPAFALPINIENTISYFGPQKLNIILIADKDNVQASDVSWKN